MKANIFMAVAFGFSFLVVIAFAWLYSWKLLIPIVILGVLGAVVHLGWGKSGEI